MKKRCEKIIEYYHHKSYPDIRKYHRCKKKEGHDGRHHWHSFGGGESWDWNDEESDN